jgi:hypothetical protein
MSDGGGYETDDYDDGYDDAEPRRRDSSGGRRGLWHDLLPENRFVAILVAGAIVMIFIMLLVYR